MLLKQYSFPKIEINIDGQIKIYSLLSAYTENKDFPYLNGIQGQFVDRTEEYNLRKEKEELLDQKLRDQEIIEEKTRKLENIANRLSKYLSPQVYKSIFNEEDIGNENKTPYSRKNLTIFFSDIQNFTDLSDTLEPEKLANVKYIKYKSRDGKTLHAYVTIPNGKGPFPAIVMLHGGPFVQEVVGYDEWGQMLANNGYLVVQPQYRGSQGYGIDYYRSAFLPKGLGGYQMQDDKDDAVLHLVKEGLVDKDRIAMFGWSYGGYAALIAASRKPQIYQCAIAGAAVSDNKYQLDQYRDRMRDDSSSSVEQLNFWTDSISPIKEVSKVNIPLLMIHGSVDQRVPPEHAKRYLEEARETGTKVDYVELDGADHFSNTLFYDHQKLLYESMISYLQNKCGPEGL